MLYLVMVALTKNWLSAQYCHGRSQIIVLLLFDVLVLQLIEERVRLAKQLKELQLIQQQQQQLDNQQQ